MKKNPSKLRVTDLCAGNPPVTGEFPAQSASNAENVSFWWRYHETLEKDQQYGTSLRQYLELYSYEYQNTIIIR